MAWTYSPICAEAKDKVRLLIGDTDEDSQLLQDEEIDLFLTISAQNVSRAAATAARGLAAKFSSRASKQVGDLSIRYLDRTRGYLDLAKMLESQADRYPVAPYAGGISEADKDLAAEDSDRVDPLFYRGAFQDPQSVASDSSSAEDTDCVD